MLGSWKTRKIGTSLQYGAQASSPTCINWKSLLNVGKWATTNWIKAGRRQLCIRSDDEPIGKGIRRSQLRSMLSLRGAGDRDLPVCRARTLGPPQVHERGAIEMAHPSCLVSRAQSVSRSKGRAEWLATLVWLRMERRSSLPAW